MLDKARKADRQVLLVEDDPSICEAISEVLDLENISVRTVSSGQDGLDELKGGFRPNLILLDLMMPGTDGIWFCTERDKYPEYADIPVIVLSAHGQVEARTSNLKISSVLRKPIGLDDLLQAVLPYFTH